MRDSRLVPDVLTFDVTYIFTTDLLYQPLGLGLFFDLEEGLDRSTLAHLRSTIYVRELAEVRHIPFETPPYRVLLRRSL